MESLSPREIKQQEGMQNAEVEKKEVPSEVEEVEQEEVEKQESSPTFSIRIDKDAGKLFLGNRTFVVRGGTGSFNADTYPLLEEACKLIEKKFNTEELRKILANSELLDTKITLSTSGLKVSGRVKQEGEISDQSSAQLQVFDISQKTPQGIQKKDIAKVQEYPKEYKKHMDALQTITENWSSKLIAKSCGKILEEGHMRLGDIFAGIAELSEWGDLTLADILHDPGNEALRAALHEIQKKAQHEGETAASKKEEVIPYSKKQCKRAQQELRLYLLKNLKRNALVYERSEKGATVERYVQHVQRIRGPGALSFDVPLDSEKTFAKDEAWPAEAEKEEAQPFVEHPANLGAVIAQNPGMATKCVVTRSGRTDNFARLKEAVASACLEQLQTDEPLGFATREDGTIEFQHVITSYKDLSRAKSLEIPVIKYLLPKSKENERIYMLEVLKAQDEWPEEGIAVEIKVGDGAKKIILKKPLIFNQPFSGIVKYDRYSGQQASDRTNFASNQHVFLQFAKKKGLDLSELQPEAQNFSRELEAFYTKKHGGEAPNFLQTDGLIDFNKIPHSDFVYAYDLFSSSSFQKYQQQVAKILLSKLLKSPEDLILVSLYCMLFRKRPPDNIREQLTKIETFVPSSTTGEELHAADLEIFRNTVLDDLKLSKGKQCKGGTDRTPIGVALAVAQDRFFMKYNKPFMPLGKDDFQEDERIEELLFFKKCFRDSIKEFGIKMTVETRGYFGLNWKGGGGNPVPLKYLYTGEDLSKHMQTLQKIDPNFTERKSQEPDVIGYLEEAAYTKEKGQYQGKLRSVRQLFSKTSDRVRQDVGKEQKEIEETTVLKVQDELANFFEKDLGLKTTDLGFGQNDSIKNLFNKRLELDVHVRKLNLDHMIPGGAKSRLTLIEEKIAAERKQLPIALERITQATTGDARKEQEQQALKTKLRLYALENVHEIWLRRAAIKNHNAVQETQFSPEILQTNVEKNLKALSLPKASGERMISGAEEEKTESKREELVFEELHPDDQAGIKTSQFVRLPSRTEGAKLLPMDPIKEVTHITEYFPLIDKWEEFPGKAKERIMEIIRKEYLPKEIRDLGSLARALLPQVDWFKPKHRLILEALDRLVVEQLLLAETRGDIEDLLKMVKEGQEEAYKAKIDAYTEPELRALVSDGLKYFTEQIKDRVNAETQDRKAQLLRANLSEPEDRVYRLLEKTPVTTKDRALGCIKTVIEEMRNEKIQEIIEQRIAAVQEKILSEIDEKSPSDQKSILQLLKKIDRKGLEEDDVKFLDELTQTVQKQRSISRDTLKKLVKGESFTSQEIEQKKQEILQDPAILSLQTLDQINALPNDDDFLSKAKQILKPEGKISSSEREVAEKALAEEMAQSLQEQLAPIKKIGELITKRIEELVNERQSTKREQADTHLLTTLANDRQIRFQEGPTLKAVKLSDCLILTNTSVIATRHLFEKIYEALQNDSFLGLQKANLLQFCINWTHANKDTKEFENAKKYLYLIIAGENTKKDVSGGNPSAHGKIQDLTDALHRELMSIEELKSSLPKKTEQKIPDPKEQEKFTSIIDTLRKTRFGSPAKYDLAVREMALSLKQMQRETYAKISPHDLVGKKWADGKPESIHEVADEFNKTTNFFTRLMLQEKSTQDRVRVMKFLLNVAHRSLKIYDFATAQAINAAFQSVPIHRLTKTTAFLGKLGNKEYKEVYSTLEALGKRDGNYAKYREMIRPLIQEEKEFVPYLGLIRQDVTFREQGNSSEFSKDESTYNYTKLMSLYLDVHQGLQAQNFASLKAEKKASQINFGKLFENYTPAEDKYLDRRSKEIQPREK